MTATDFLSLGTLIVSVIGIIVAIIALRRSRIADDASKNYQAVQEKLAQLELIRLTQKASILVSFSIEHTTHYRSINTRGINHADQVVPESRRIHYLVVRNVGNVEARNIELRFSPVSEGGIPYPLEKIKPITILASGLDVTYEVMLSANDSKDLTGKWKWENPDGTQEVRESYLLIPTN